MRQFLWNHRLWLVALAVLIVTSSALAAVLLLTSGRPSPIKPTPTPGVSITPSASPSPSASEKPSPQPTASVSPSPTNLPSPAPTATVTVPPTATGRRLPASLRSTEWYALPTSSKIVALTFDAGSGDQGLAKILRTLADKNVPGTFFLTGQFIARYPNDARSIAAYDMHSIGNHTVDHPHMNQLSDQQARAEILGAEQSIVSASGREPWPLFRFPYGESSSRTIAIANGLGYGSIRWTVDTLGWEGTQPVGGSGGGQTVQTVVSRTLSAARPGEIVLMHVGAAPDGTTLDADALGSIIDGLRARGYGFVAVWDFINGLS